jgi:nucleotide-binding universal stress UspA family protein
MTARVVVGVDGSDHSNRALDAAVAQARSHHATLEVVHAWMPAVSVELPDYVGVAEERDVREAAAYEVMKDVVARLPDDLDVEWRIEEGSPAAVLLERAEGAELLVVGARGRGGFIGLLLGSTSTQVATHAPCPVLVVRGGDDG